MRFDNRPLLSTELYLPAPIAPGTDNIAENQDCMWDDYCLWEKGFFSVQQVSRKFTCLIHKEMRHNSSQSSSSTNCLPTTLNMLTRYGLKLTLFFVSQPEYRSDMPNGRMELAISVTWLHCSICIHEEAWQQIQTDNTRKQSVHGGISMLCNLNKQCLISSRMSHKQADDPQGFSASRCRSMCFFHECLKIIFKCKTPPLFVSCQINQIVE